MQILIQLLFKHLNNDAHPDIGFITVLPKQHRKFIGLLGLGKSIDENMI